MNKAVQAWRRVVADETDLLVHLRVGCLDRGQAESRT
jgi:hypothetical protein